MWTYTTGGIAENVWGVIDPNTKPYQDAGDWTGVLFAVQAVGSILWAMVIPQFRNVKVAYSLSLVLGAVGFVSTYFIHDQYMLFVSFLLIGCAWAAMLALPFAMLTSSLSGKSLGSYMGLFNCTICLPQIIASLAGIAVMKYVGEEIFVNELKYADSPKIENCALVYDDGDSDVRIAMEYNDAEKCYVVDSLALANVAESTFRIEANDGKVKYGINKDAAKSSIAVNEPFGMTRCTKDVAIKNVHVTKVDKDGNAEKMDDMLTAYFYPGCDRLFVMEASWTFEGDILSVCPECGYNIHVAESVHKDYGEKFPVCPSCNAQMTKSHDIAKVMPKATSGQISMFIIAGAALLLGALAVFGISTKRKE
jgi:hypothetical protein